MSVDKPKSEKQQKEEQPSSGTTLQRGERGAAERGGAAMLPSMGPLSLMRRLFDDLDRLSGIGRPKEQSRTEEVLFIPDVEVTRQGDKIQVQVDLPGLKVEDMNVTMENGALTIEGVRRSEHEETQGDVWTCERVYGRFQRVIPLPDTADPDSIDASFDNGVLQVSIRAPEERERGRKIDIKQGQQQGRQSPQR